MVFGDQGILTWTFNFATGILGEQVDPIHISYIYIYLESQLNLLLLKVNPPPQNKAELPIQNEGAPFGFQVYNYKI